jgi:hypothetical protein
MLSKPFLIRVEPLDSDAAGVCMPAVLKSVRTSRVKERAHQPC